MSNSTWAREAAYRLSNGVRARAAAIAVSRASQKSETARFPDGQLVVSLTSYPPRFATLDLTLRSLLLQTVQPDHVVLWIANQDMDALPKEVRRLESWNLEIKATADLRSYKKIIPALAAFPSAYIVTADDDVYYPPNWLSTLVDAVDPINPHIACHRGHMPAFELSGAMSPYAKWRWNVSCAEGSQILFPTGVGGVMYPPNSLAREVMDEETFLSLCPSADDVWLYFMGRLADARYRTTAEPFRILNWPRSQKESLHSKNVVDNANDVQIRAMERRFGVLPSR
ncbi:glycosyltransferase family 2 protein [Caulobacter sp. S45]|jgi:hypothetical protein|uniref:glycosyltransferase family 2 protein n=1 Tax=Caulobacter sp. S45 TaxID=1641861 RepID=UPI00131A68D7|nr:glycosyltransferase family 2 protein [Caulobacter sp. S45]